MIRSRRTRSRRSVRPRRPLRRRRITKRRPTVKRAISKKRILNITSRKKRDVMNQWSNTTADGGSKPITNGIVTLAGPVGGYFYWQATARTLDQGPGQIGIVSDEATRTATTCFMRGLSERIDIQTNSSLPWRWRRICITTKDNSYDHSDLGALQAYGGWLLSSAGIVRPWVNSYINNNGTTQAGQWVDLFEGAGNVDWADVNSAKVDTRRIDLHYDKTITINSGNSSGVFRTYRRWHPMNKNLVYDDDQDGGKMDSSHLSVTDKRGMGNYIVLDFFQPHASATSADRLILRSNSALFWHEK